MIPKMFEMTPDEFDVMLRCDLYTFLHRCFIELNPSMTLSEAAHLHVLAAKLSDCLLGKGPRRLIINLPPRSLKSISVSVAAVAWFLGLDPTKQIICASYGQDLADKHARDTRTIMQSSFYRRTFPHTQLAPNKLSVNDFYTTKHGFRMATSVGGVVTGRGADVLIIDDPLKPEQAMSESGRKEVNDWYDNTFLSRQNSKENGIIIIVMQRLHQDDLVGHVLDRGEEWDLLSFPAIAEKDESTVIQTATGPFHYRRRIDEVLDPKRESLETLLNLKTLIGSYNFASQYQQNPTPVGGAMVKKEWLKYYDPEQKPDFYHIIQSWDTANKSGELNDYSVCTTWGQFEDNFYLLDVVRVRLECPDLKRRIKEEYAKWTPVKVLIEDKASGTSLIQDLRREGFFRVEAYAPSAVMDKIMRLNTQTAEFEAGHVWVPYSATWLEPWITEIVGFPGTKYADQVDSTTQALDYMKTHRSLSIWIKLGRTPYHPQGYPGYWR